MLRLRPQVALRGDSIYRVGEPGKDLFFLGRGSAELRFAADPGRCVTLRPGDFFGEAEAFSVSAAPRRGASCTAVSTCDLYRVGRAELEELLVEFPESADLVHSAVVARSRELRDRAVVDEPAEAPA